MGRPHGRDPRRGPHGGRARAARRTLPPTAPAAPPAPHLAVGTVPPVTGKLNSTVWAGSPSSGGPSPAAEPGPGASIASPGVRPGFRTPRCFWSASTSSREMAAGSASAISGAHGDGHVGAPHARAGAAAGAGARARGRPRARQSATRRAAGAGRGGARAGGRRRRGWRAWRRGRHGLAWRGEILIGCGRGGMRLVLTWLAALRTARPATHHCSPAAAGRGRALTRRLFRLWARRGDCGPAAAQAVGVGGAGRAPARRARSGGRMTPRDRPRPTPRDAGRGARGMGTAAAY
jgi:hypothetical protein